MKKEVYVVTFSHTPNVEYCVGGNNIAEAIERAWYMYICDNGEVNSCLKIDVKVRKGTL